MLPETSAETAEIIAAILTGQRPADGRAAPQPGGDLEGPHDVGADQHRARRVPQRGLGRHDRTLPSLLAVPVEGTGPTIIAAHPVAPVPGEMAAWRQGLRWLADRCAGQNVILAGDLNSTLDHYTGLGTDGGELGRCHDAAKASGDAAAGTWPLVPSCSAHPSTM